MKTYCFVLASIVSMLSGQVRANTLPYSWTRDAGDLYYRGTVYFADGSKAQFLSRHNRIFFPAGSRVVISAFGTSDGERSESREAYADTAVPPPQDAPEPPTLEETEQPVVEVAADTEPFRLEVKLCSAWDLGASLYTGSESLEATAGAKKFAADAMILGTAIAGACTPHGASFIRVEVDARKHNLNVNVTEKNFLGDEEKNQTFSRLLLSLGIMGKKSTPWGVIGAGLVANQMDTAVLNLRDTGTDNGVLETRVIKGYGLRMMYENADRHDGASVVVEYLGGQDQLQWLRIEPRFAMPFGQNFSWWSGLALTQHQVQFNTDCQDCADVAASESQLLTLEAGLSAHL